MKRIDDVLSKIERLTNKQTLEDYIARGWVRPVRDETDYIFDEMDIARIQLVCELHIEMKFEIDAVDLILSLIDQLYESRAQFEQLAKTLQNKPSEFRADNKSASESGTNA